MQLRRGVLVLGLLLFLSPLVPAEEEKAEVRVESVSLFKNGLAFFRSSVQLPEQGTTVEFGQLPVPAYGTFWVSYPENLELRQLVTRMEAFQKPTPITSMNQLLRLNAGREVILHTKAEAGGPIRGTLVAWRDAAPAATPTPYSMGPSTPETFVRLGASRPGLVMLREGTDLVAVAEDAILRADFTRSGAVTTATSSFRRPSLRVELDSPARGATLHVSWLAKGITWQPSYRIDLSDPETARLDAKALVINEVTDLEAVPLNLVTGFPHIKFGEVRSPLAKQEPLAEFLRALSSDRTGTGSGGARGQLVTQQSLLANLPGVPGWESGSSDGSVGSGSVSEDLFLYPVDPVTLKKDETAYIPVFTADLPYQHIYTWEIADYLDQEDRYRANRGPEQSTEEVWHSCRLENTLDFPLTTAAAEFVNGGQFVGQDVAYYTPPGSKATIRINRALNVLAEQGEFEESRQRNHATFQRLHYDLVTVRGELKLRNGLDREIRLEVRKDLSGEVQSMEPAGQDVKTAKGLRRINPRHRLVWEVDLGPGESTTIRYRYEVYIRS